MYTPRTHTQWVNTSDRLPDRDTYGPYPRVMVAISYHNQPDYGFGLRFAELRFINGDPSRPMWLECDKGLAPLETYAYGVTHWAPLPEDPRAQSTPQP